MTHALVFGTCCALEYLKGYHFSISDICESFKGTAYVSLVINVKILTVLRGYAADNVLTVVWRSLSVVKLHILIDFGKAFDSVCMYN